MSRYRKTRNRKLQKLEAMLQEPQICLPFPEPQEEINPAEYDTELCNKIIRHCKNGASIFEFAAELNVSTATLLEWAEEHPEFEQALDKANTILKAYWLKLAAEECRNRFSINIWKHIMLNLFGPDSEINKNKSDGENERCVVILPEIEHADESCYAERDTKALEAPESPATGTQIRL